MTRYVLQSLNRERSRFVDAWLARQLLGQGVIERHGHEAHVKGLYVYFRPVPAEQGRCVGMEGPFESLRYCLQTGGQHPRSETWKRRYLGT